MKKLLAISSFMLLLNLVLAQTCQAGFRSFEHITGSSCIPENPQRIVALEWTYVENLLALGIQPIAVADIEGYHDWVKIPVALSEKAVEVGDRNEPNLERIAELKPDLIIGVKFRLSENYDELSAIAPTLVFDPYPEDVSQSQYDEMLSTFARIAEAVNRQAEAQQVIEKLEASFESAGSALRSAGRKGEAFILSQGWSFDNAATFRLFTSNAMAVQILEQIGLENVWDAEAQVYGFTQVGMEGFAELKDADLNFFYVALQEDKDFFEGSELWNTVSFIKHERAYWLGGDAWLFGGPHSAQVVVETVLRSMGISQ